MARIRYESRASILIPINFLFRAKLQANIRPIVLLSRPDKFVRKHVNCEPKFLIVPLFGAFPRDNSLGSSDVRRKPNFAIV